MSVQTKLERAGLRHYLERRLWTRDHTRTPVESLVVSKEHAMKLARPTIQLTDLLEDDRKLHELEDQSGAYADLRSQIAVRAESEYNLSVAEQKSYNPAVEVEDDHNRQPRLLFSVHRFAPGGELDEDGKEPTLDWSSEDESELSSHEDDPDKEAKKLEAADFAMAAGDAKAAGGDSKRAAGDSKRAADDSMQPAALRRRYPGGRYNLQGTPRGSRFRDVRMPRRMLLRSEFAFLVHGGLLHYDLHPSNHPGQHPLSSCLSPPRVPPLPPASAVVDVRSAWPCVGVNGPTGYHLLVEPWARNAQAPLSHVTGWHEEGDYLASFNQFTGVALADHQPRIRKYDWPTVGATCIEEVIAILQLHADQDRKELARLVEKRAKSKPASGER